MPHDPRRVAEARAWLIRAYRDLQTTEALVLAREVYDAVVARLPTEARP